MVQVDYFLFGKSSGIYTLAFGTHFPAFSSCNSNSSNSSNNSNDNNHNFELRFCLAWHGLAHPCCNGHLPTTTTTTTTTTATRLQLIILLHLLCRLRIRQRGQRPTIEPEPESERPLNSHNYKRRPTPTPTPPPPPPSQQLLQRVIDAEVSFYSSTFSTSNSFSLQPDLDSQFAHRRQVAANCVDQQNGNDGQQV
ncbi:hypothetical protein ACLKA7_007216 [Drosophila subpalustris]